MNKTNQDLRKFDTVNTTYYEDGIQHLFAELECIDLYIQYFLSIIQKDFDHSDQYRGLYLTEPDIQSHFARPIGEPWWALDSGSGGISNISSLVDEKRISISQAVSHSHEHGVELRLDALRKRFDLEQTEVDIILIALAADIDLRYEQVYAYLHDDITKKYASIELCLNILGSDSRDKLRIRRCFNQDSTLVEHRLIDLSDDPARSCSSQLGKIVRVPQRIVDFLLDNPAVDSTIKAMVKIVDIDDLILAACVDPGLGSRLTQIAAQYNTHSESYVISLNGKHGSGKRQAAAFLAQKIHHKLLTVDLQQLLNVDPILSKETLSLIHRESLLQRAVTYYGNAHLLSGEDAKVQQSALLNHISRYNRGLVVLAGQTPFDIAMVAQINNYYQYDVGNLTTLNRAELWRSYLTNRGIVIDDEEIIGLADRFRFSQGQIRNTISTARQMVTARGGIPSHVDIDELYLASRLNTNTNLGKLARHITPKYEWSDITLENDTMKQLEELHNTVKHHAKVLEEWGFDKKLSIGKGVNALFSGPPGTGKTMAAEIIAKSLGLDLYKIDLSLIVSKYIGETEKNLSKIFHEAETSNAILFFDEADALFGKRTEVKNSHDRYANVEVAYLLQKMEDYTGITIMATNLRRNMDDAFTRRLAFIIDFPFPGVSERLQIWKNIWPSQTPIRDDIDFEFLANNFKLAGGNIKNIALAASFLAAQEREKVGMRQLLASTRREFEKQGRTFVQNDYGKYSHLLEAV